MRRLDRYIATTLLGHILLALAVLLALYSLFALLEELDDIGKGHYGPAKALLFVLFTLPSRLFEVFPGSALLGTLLGLGQLASHRELIAMRAAGMSIARIAWAAIKVGLALLPLVLLTGEVLAPRAELYAESMRTIAITGSVALRTRNGFWMREGDDFINVVEILPGPVLRHVHLYSFDGQGRLSTMAYAEEARYLKGRWRLRNIHLSRIEDQGVNAMHLPEASWETLLSPDLIKVVATKPKYFSALDLWRYIRYLRANLQDTQLYELTLWIKLTTPLATLAMVFLAIPFILGPLGPSGIGMRILTGVLVGSAFYVLNRISAHMGLVYGFPPALAATLPTALFSLAGLWLLRRVR